MNTFLSHKKNLHYKKKNLSAFYTYVLLILYAFLELFSDKCYAKVRVDSSFSTVQEALKGGKEKPQFKKFIEDTKLLPSLETAVDQQMGDAMSSKGYKRLKEKCNNGEKIRYALKLDGVGKNIYIVSDCHGCAKDFSNILKDMNILEIKKGLLGNKLSFKIKDSNILIATGDYVDRGEENEEMIYLLERLKKENPKNFYIIRGNHEFKSTAVKAVKGKAINENSMEGNFFHINGIEHYFTKPVRWLQLMFPSAIYIKVKNGQNENDNKYYLFSHGAFDEEFDPQKLFNNEASTAIAPLHNLAVSAKASFEASDFVYQENNDLFVMDATIRGAFEIRAINLKNIGDLPDKLPGYKNVIGIIGGHQHIEAHNAPVSTLTTDVNEWKVGIVSAKTQSEKFTANLINPIKTYSSLKATKMLTIGYLTISAENPEEITPHAIPASA